MPRNPSSTVVDGDKLAALQRLNGRFGNRLRLQAVHQAGQVGHGFAIQSADKGVKMLV